MRKSKNSEVSAPAIGGEIDETIQIQPDFFTGENPIKALILKGFQRCE